MSDASVAAGTATGDSTTGNRTTGGSTAGGSATGGHATNRPGFLTIWWSAARPKTLTAAVAPVLVGLACAYQLGGLNVGRGILCVAGALLLQIAANFANDVFDFERGADTPLRTGPLRVVQAGWVRPAEMRRGLGVVLALGVVVAAALTAVAGPAIVAIAILSILAAVAYTGGPYPLGYHGLGDLCVFVFFGLVAVVGTTFVQLGSAPTLAWWSAVPVGCLSTAVLVVNNVRDEPQDRQAGKRTLAVRWGRRFALAEYAALVVLAHAVSVTIAISHAQRWVWGVLPLLTVPWAVNLVRALPREQGSALNPRLAATARLLFVHSVLLAAALVLGAPA
jgi:1,4-dihydroxy-2-naphthoate polyprenyltransferase